MDHFYVISQNFWRGELFDLLQQHRYILKMRYAFTQLRTFCTQISAWEKYSLSAYQAQKHNYRSCGAYQTHQFCACQGSQREILFLLWQFGLHGTQILKEYGYPYQIDYYSLDNLLFEILMGSPPFYHSKHTLKQTKHQILHQEVNFFREYDLSSSAIYLLTKLLQRNPQKRLGQSGKIEQILKHPRFSGLNVRNYYQKVINLPIKAEIKFFSAKDEQIYQQNRWQFLIQQDIIKQKKRDSLVLKKQKHSKHSKAKTQKSCVQFQQNATQQTRSRGVLKSNLSLLFVMTQKNVITAHQSKKYQKSNSQAKNNRIFESLDLTPNSSFISFREHQQAKQNLAIKGQSPQEEFGSISGSFVASFSKKGKQNISLMLKKSKQPKSLMKFSK